MIGLKESFGTVSLEQWLTRLKKDLKSEDLHELTHADSIENIVYQSHLHQKNVSIAIQAPGEFPFQRGAKTSSNKWSNCFEIIVENEETANQKALEVLMNGVDSLVFVLKKPEINFDVLLKDIGLEYIQSCFVLQNHQQLLNVINGPAINHSDQISVCLDFHKENDIQPNLGEIVSLLKGKRIPFLLADGYSIQQCGANISQEIAFVLASSHDYLFQLISAGMTVDEASACIHFYTGVGSNYFFEIAKYRAIRQLWSKIVAQYQPADRDSHNCLITAKIGLMNKSVKDPHTNLLRQTTETMSAVAGGADSIIVTPHDQHTSFGTSNLAERMAINISLILKEESYLDSVIDPAGGSYTVEQLTTLFSEQAWKIFQSIENSGGIFNEEAKSTFLAEVKVTAAKRLELLQTKSQTLIGVNKFPNPEMVENTSLPAEKYLGLPLIIFERDI